MLVEAPQTSSIPQLSLSEYPLLLTSLAELQDPNEVVGHLRNLCRLDLYFLLRYGLKRVDVEKQWLFDRCREVQADPNWNIDLWARDHYKSTIITFAKTIQDVLASHGENPLQEWDGREVCVGIFSHTRPAAKSLLRQIKMEFEQNELLKEWFPDILWKNPKAEAPKWSEDDGLIVKRKTNPKEATLEAWGLVDGQPTGKHFPVLVYDDVVTLASVTTAEQIEKTTLALTMSYNLGTQDGIRRMIGTRYDGGDTYKTVMDRGTFKPRLYPATDNGTVSGKPVFLSQKAWDDKVRDTDSYTLSCQQLQNPQRADGGIIKPKHWRKWEGPLPVCSMIIQSWDTAFEKGQENDYSARTTWGIFDHEDKKTGEVRAAMIVLERWQEKVEFPELRELAWASYQDYKPDYVLIEKKASGQSLIQELRRKGVPVRTWNPDKYGSKLLRTHTASVLWNQGCVFYPDKPWAQEVINHCAAFPKGEHDDLHDTVIQTALWVRRTLHLNMPDEDNGDDDDLPQMQQQRRLYGTRRN